MGQNIAALLTKCSGLAMTALSARRARTGDCHALRARLPPACAGMAQAGNDARSACTGYTKRPRRSEATTRPTVRQDTNSPPRAGEGEGTKGWVVCEAKRAQIMSGK